MGEVTRAELQSRHGKEETDKVAEGVRSFCSPRKRRLRDGTPIWEAKLNVSLAKLQKAMAQRGLSFAEAV